MLHYVKNALAHSRGGMNMQGHFFSGGTQPPALSPHYTFNYIRNRPWLHSYSIQHFKTHYVVCFTYNGGLSFWRVGELWHDFKNNLHKAFALWSCRYKGQIGAHLILGGVDCTGSHLYTVGPYGSMDKVPYLAMGVYFSLVHVIACS